MCGGTKPCNILRWVSQTLKKPIFQFQSLEWKVWDTGFKSLNYTSVDPKQLVTSQTVFFFFAGCNGCGLVCSSFLEFKKWPVDLRSYLHVLQDKTPESNKLPVRSFYTPSRPLQLGLEGPLILAPFPSAFCPITICWNKIQVCETHWNIELLETAHHQRQALHHMPGECRVFPTTFGSM